MAGSRIRFAASGGYTTIQRIPHAFFYENGVTHDFLTGRREYSAAADINDAGDILVGCGSRSYLYRNGDLIDLEKAIGDAGRSPHSVAGG